MGFIFSLVLASGLWTTGILQDLFAGPKIPLPREVLGFSLGMSLDDVLQKYPLMNLGDLFRENPNMSLEEILKKNHKLTKKKVAEMEKNLRPFNNDPNFGIATIMPQTGLANAGLRGRALLSAHKAALFHLRHVGRKRRQDRPRGRLDQDLTDAGSRTPAKRPRTSAPRSA